MEIKCEIHDKDLIFLIINEKKLYCEDCKINSIFDLISLISKFPSKIIYSNNEIFYGNLINYKILLFRFYQVLNLILRV